MNHDSYPDRYIRGILNAVKTIAMVGIRAPRQAPARSPGAHRPHPARGRDLQVVRSGMSAPADELAQRLERDRASVGDLGFGRPAPAHRDDDRIEPVGPGHARGLARDGGLARSLTDPDDRDRRDGERSLVDRRVEPEVRTEVGDSPCQGDGRDLHPLPVPEHGFVRQVEDRLGGELVDRAGERRRHGTVRDRTPERDP